jgi:outer membrane protein
MFTSIPAALAIAVAGFPQAPPEGLSLQEAIDIALENSYAVRRAKATAQKSREQVNEGYAGMRPTLTGEFIYTRFDEETVAEFPAQDEHGNPITQSIVISPVDQRTGSLTLAQPVDIVGRQRAGVSGAKAFEHASRAGLTAEEATVIRDTKLAYLDVLRAEAAVGIAEEAVTNAEERQRLAEAQVSAGTASKIDILRAKTQVAQNRQLLIQAHNGVALAASAFNNVLGRDVGEPVRLVALAGMPEVAATLDDLIQRATEARPEVRQAEWLVRFSREMLRLEKLGNLPSLSLAVTLDHNFDTTLFNSRKDRITGVAVFSVPIFDGHLTRARVGQARADLESADVTLQEIRQAIGLEVKQSYLMVGEAEQRLDTAEAAMTEAEEALRLAQLRYKNGVGIQLEVSDAELALTQARLNELNARFDYLDAYARLQRAVGMEGV